MNKSARSSLAALLAAGALALSERASAQAGPFPAGGFSLQNIEPAPSGDRFFFVPDGYSDADPREEGKLPIRAMVLAHYALTPPFSRTSLDTGTDENVIERQLVVHTNLTVLAASWLLVNADFPVVPVQEGVAGNSPGAAISDLRLGARFGLFGTRSSAFSFAPGIQAWLPTGSPDDVTGDGALRGEPYLSVSGKVGVFIYAAKVGYLFRNHVATGAQSAEVGSSLTSGAAFGLSLFDETLQVGPELSGFFLTDSSTDRAFRAATSPLRASLGARVQIGDFNLGAGYAIPVFPDPAPGESQRVFANFAYMPKSREKDEPRKVPDRDGDGIGDTVDACPLEAGVASEEPKENGCPPKSGLKDADNDGVPDEVDACPDVFGDSSAEAEKNGCPRPKVVEKVIAPAAAPPPPAPVVKEVCVVQKDRDGDSVEDVADQCPDEPGPRELRGCPKNVTGKVAKKTGGKPTATFVGFRQLEGEKVLVYVELTHGVPIEQTTIGDQEIRYRMPGTVVTLRNNQNPLLATHFESIVTEARLVQAGKDTWLHMKLRQDVETSSRVVNSIDGAVLEVEIRPKGSDGAAAPATPKK